MAMPTADRRDRILGLAHERGEIHVAGLSQHLGVSAVTIPPQLSTLARRGLLVRTHGGALVPEHTSAEQTFAAREVSNVILKRRIGLAAAELNDSGQSLVLDASTTGLQLARALRTRRLHDVTIITNGVHTA